MVSIQKQVFLRVNSSGILLCVYLSKNIRNNTFDILFEGILANKRAWYKLIVNFFDDTERKFSFKFLRSIAFLCFIREMCYSIVDFFMRLP